ncbi:hypothetical protein G6L28_08800 [Agrobacterium larrymoorei]|uniref:hypothetical protein n=1 Tax=Agrobacterium larrymoorei TaxID=160699 RepID=UPI0015731C88|nr:hypothetical protein [Agrobacterium larrymoorei]NTJ42691.1 hypothetical protein [Agrobacterium larrymoorei]
MQIDCDYIQANWDWAGHMLEALVMALIVAVIFRLFLNWHMSAIAGFAFAAGHFHGREKRDYEVSVKMLPPHLEGYYFWNWSWDQATDFWPTAFLCLLVIWVISRRLKY